MFGKDVRTINEHLQNIFAEGELPSEATIRKIRIVQTEGNREVAREVDFYNLDAIIAVGYRVNSYQATQFRIWATKTLKEFIIKGFVLDDERLKNYTNVPTRPKPHKICPIPNNSSSFFLSQPAQ